MVKQRGVSLVGTIVTLAVLGFVGIMVAKTLPAYLEYNAVKKMIAAMDRDGDLKGNVRDIRNNFNKRNAIEDVKNVRADDLEITKEGGETVVSVGWSVKVPLVSNISACLDFFVSSAPQ